MRERVSDVMGGKVLPLPSDKLREVEAQGEARGKAEGKAEDLFNLMNSLKLSFEQAVDILKIPTDEWAFYKKVVAEKGMM